MNGSAARSMIYLLVRVCICLLFKSQMLIINLSVWHNVIINHHHPPLHHNNNNNQRSQPRGVNSVQPPRHRTRSRRGSGIPRDSAGCRSQTRNNYPIRQLSPRSTLFWYGCLHHNGAILLFICKHRHFVFSVSIPESGGGPKHVVEILLKLQKIAILGKNCKENVRAAPLGTERFMLE